MEVECHSKVENCPFRHLRHRQRVSTRSFCITLVQANSRSSGLLASILRFNSFYSTNSFIDATFHAIELIIWTIAELGIYLISACLLMFRPLLEKVNLGFFANVKSYITGNRSKAADSNVANTSRLSHRKDPDGEMGIALAVRGPNKGFRRLDDSSEGKSPSPQISSRFGVGNV
ncbi:hypothetical protein F4779DRAFT_612164 [Xylariaceae sp. FL0662B]|nr:hypothetical protein F4779DRAFT_612164 [Xylariaceae sp. FL0662B]